jgi:hypothetical protein
MEVSEQNSLCASEFNHFGAEFFAFRAYFLDFLLFWNFLSVMNIETFLKVLFLLINMLAIQVINNVIKTVLILQIEDTKLFLKRLQTSFVKTDY